MQKLVIVESPAKATTIKKYLGRGFDVIASMGHIRDLPKSTLGVDVENNFEPKYKNIKGKEEIIKELKAKAKKADKVYLATDPDREGEAISFHLAALLGLDLEDENRVTFNEITKSGVKSGMAQPRAVDKDLFNAQQARRILDRIVGYKLSPFLWRKVKRGLSAGRVQSVAVNIIVTREEEIKAFTPTEYWSIEASLEGSGKSFTAKFHSKKDGKKIDLNNKEETDAILKSLEGAQFKIDKITFGKREKRPAPPFITSTLQQEASRRMYFNAVRTMRIAQTLYEGVKLPSGETTGLITYMRTDSLRVSPEALNGARSYIESTFGSKYLPESPKFYSKKKNSQDAHEAIRPTDVFLTPESIKSSLTTDQYKVYRLIWERFVASQMENAILQTVRVDIGAADNIFKASGYTVQFDGFTALYEEKKDEEDEGNTALPPLSQDEILKLLDIKGNQHFTQPPPRFTEATLIRLLEENGIGRPSTYAPTIGTIIARNYVEREGRALKPTAAGEVTSKLMDDYFDSVINIKFTAGMEENLDKIEEGSVDWREILSSFYGDFIKTFEKAEVETEGKRFKIPEEETDIICELCGKNMIIRQGRFGKFLACPGFPECTNTKKLIIEVTGKCPQCEGNLVENKSKKGKKFYGCKNYPECNFMTWDMPQKENCPECGSTLFKKGFRGGAVSCLKDGCGFTKEKKAPATATEKKTATKKPAAKKTTTKKATTKKTAAKKTTTKKSTAKKVSDD